MSRNESSKKAIEKQMQEWAEAARPEIREQISELVTALLEKIGSCPDILYEINFDSDTHCYSQEELNNVIAAADKKITENKDDPKKLAKAYLAKAQCLQKLEDSAQFENMESKETDRNINVNTQEQIKALLEKTLKLFPNMPEALKQMGKYYFKMSIAGHDYLDKAIEMYNNAIQLEPNYSDAFNNRGVLYASEVYSRGKNNNAQDSWHKAIDDFTSAIRIYSYDEMYYFNRGKNYSKLKEHEKAIDDFSKAIKYGPDEFKKKTLIFYLRGKEYTELANYEKAISNFSESLRLRPDYIRALLMRGNAYFGAGEKDKAKADMDEYLRRKRGNTK
jgi:tetratricopeptide (TPR) repeat protein